ncbi:MAG: putative toxin-antitoxin system toxin component, PIN family [Lentisphaeria bacterium]|nr:putative toxin-antitoxin system toxin component, PIN family [Lentisphaeria bacterium]
MKVFLDTNVVAAAFATRGLCSDLVREVLENHELVTSLEMLAELKRVLLRKFKISAEQTEEALDIIHSSALLSSPAQGAKYDIKDIDDIPHLSAAESAECTVFVTGDKELWEISPVGNMTVCSPRDFWKMISAEPD